jgi:hypothetical protein
MKLIRMNPFCKMKKNIVFLFILSAFSMNGFGQATNDAGLWSTFNLDKKLHDKFSVFLTEEFRLRENFTMVNLFYTDLGVEVRPVKFLKVSLAYRLIEKNLDDEMYSYRHRLMLDITVKKKFGDFVLSYRHRLQSEVRNIYTSRDGSLPEWYSRNKFTVKYDFGKKIVPYIGAEFRYQISNPRALESDGTWHRSRYSAGLDYKVNDKSTFGLYYLIQNEYNVSAPQDLYIVGVEYSLSL